MQPANIQLFTLPVIVLFCTIKLVIAASLGDFCIDHLRKLNGTCKYISDCPNILYLKYNGGSNSYVSCGYGDNEEVVCCGERIIIEPRTNAELPNAHMKYFRKCEQYKSEIFTESSCRHNTFPMVVDGEDAKPKEFPHMALIGCSGDNGTLKWICGGTLISSNFILTAAHCIASTECNQITDVRLGELNLASIDDDARPKDYKVEIEIPHPRYNESMQYNDIGLLKLTTDVEFNEYVRPACLPYQDYSEDSQLIITGWGHTKFSGTAAPHLQKATLELFDQEKCNAIYMEDTEDKLPEGVRERVQICAGSKNSRKDTCQGDSGGPLQIVHPNYSCMYSVVGVTSFGQACGISDVPGIYTRTFYYIDWIEDIIFDQKVEEKNNVAVIKDKLKRSIFN